jgi:SH3-like domain-containing protein
MRAAMRATMLATVLVAAALLSLPASAGEYRSVGEGGAVLYDAPSREATPLYVVTADYPLEVIVQTEHWVKVRDHMGALSWIEKQKLGERHTVVVTASSAEAHLRPEDGAPVAFVAAQDVALELVGPAPGGWLRVRHADGADGYLRAALVWGG